jgi:hypothetical protein
LFVIVLLMAIPVSALSANINPTDDAQVLFHDPNTNYGANTVMNAGTGLPSGEIQSLIKFNLTPYMGMWIDSAELDVYANVKVGTPGTITIAQITGSWDEGTVTWNLRPGFGGIETTTDGNLDGVWHNISFTNAVRRVTNGSSINNGWIFYVTPLPASGNFVQFATKEDGINIPTLKITYHAPVVVGNWTFNEGTGTKANDSSGFNNNGTLTGTTWTTNLVNGAINSNALQFSGSGKVTIPTSSSLNITNAVTLWGWYKQTSNPGTYPELIGKSGSYSMYLSPGDSRVYANLNGYNTYSGSLPSTPNNEWHFYMMTYDGTTLFSYYDNVMKNSVPASGTIIVSNTDILIGNGIVGTIDETGVTNYGMNASERTAIYQQYQPVPAYPVGGLIISPVPASVSFSWHDTIYPSDELIVSTDIGFGTIIVDTFTNADSFNVVLPIGTYYWKVRQWNSTSLTYGITSATQTFSVASSIPTPGFLNINATDEANGNSISTFTINLYNNTARLSKSAVGGWVNFSGAEIITGQYLAVAIPNSSYSQRSLLMNSPGSYTMRLPNTTTTNDLVSFYLLDYTGKFPFLQSVLTISLGNNVVQSEYFDADAKSAAYLTRGTSYTITVTDPATSAFQQWGNYQSVGSGSVQVVIIDLGVNQTVFQPYTQSITPGTNNITINWNDTSDGAAPNINVVVYKGSVNASNEVYNLSAVLKSGTATYLITNTSDIYFAQIKGVTSHGTRQDTSILDLRTVILPITNWHYGSVTIPQRVKNAFAIIIIFMLAGSMGAIHRLEGAIITGIVSLFMWYYQILTLQGTVLAMFSALVLFSVLYLLAGKERTVGY